MLAFLLLGEPPHKDFFEIQAFLKAGKSAVNNALNALMQSGTIDYITCSGDRRRYFRVNSSTWINNIKERFRQRTTLDRLLEGVLQEGAGLDSLIRYGQLWRVFLVAVPRIAFQIQHVTGAAHRFLAKKGACCPNGHSFSGAD